MIRKECRAHVSRLADCFCGGAEGAGAHCEGGGWVSTCVVRDVDIWELGGGNGLGERLTIGSGVNNTGV